MKSQMEQGTGLAGHQWQNNDMIAQCGGVRQDWTYEADGYRQRYSHHERYNRCQSNTYAFVHGPAREHYVYLCPLFFKSAAAYAMDSQPGTIVHELSHFKDVMDTDDKGYGSDAVGLAKKDPSKARMNAENFNGYEDALLILSTPEGHGVRAQLCVLSFH